MVFNWLITRLKFKKILNLLYFTVYSETVFSNLKKKKKYW